MASYFRPIVLFTGILTLVQSITWFVLSLLAILSYRCSLSVPAEDNGVISFSQVLYYLYFQGPGCNTFVVELPKDPNLHLRDYVYADPYYINAWMGSYLALNITYFLIAICIFIGHCRTSNGQDFPASTIRVWCLNTFAFLIMDLWLTIIWGIDYGKLSDFVKDQNLQDTFGWAPSVPGALMAITARGFIIYLINLALFCYMVRFTFDWKNIYYCCQVNNNTSQEQLHHPNSPSNYPNQSIPRVDFEPWVDNGKSLVPVRHSEGVTPFNDWYGEPSNRSPRNMIWEEERPKRVRAPTPPKPKIRDDFQAAGYPHKSNIESQDRRNFEQGGSRPLHQGARARNNEFNY